MYTKLSRDICTNAQEYELFSYPRLIKMAPPGEGPRPADAQQEAKKDSKDAKEGVEKKGEKKENVDDKELAAAKEERDAAVKKLDTATQELQAKINTYSAENPEFSQYKGTFEADLQAVEKGLGDVKKEASDKSTYEAITKSVNTAIDKTLFNQDFQVERTRMSELSNAITKKSDFLGKNFPVGTPEDFAKFLTALNAADPSVDPNANGADNQIAHKMIMNDSGFPETVTHDDEKMQDAFHRLDQLAKVAAKHPELMQEDRKEVVSLKKDIADKVIKFFGDHKVNERVSTFLTKEYGIKEEDAAKYDTTVQNHWANAEEYLTNIDQGSTYDTVKTLKADQAVINEMMSRIEAGRPIAQSGTPENPTDLGTQYINVKAPKTQLAQSGTPGKPIDLGTQYIRAKAPKAPKAAPQQVAADDPDKKIPMDQIPNPTIEARPQQVTVIRREGDAATGPDVAAAGTGGSDKPAGAPDKAAATPDKAGGGDVKVDAGAEKAQNPEAQYDKKYYKAYTEAIQKIFEQKEGSDSTNPRFKEYQEKYERTMSNAKASVERANRGGADYVSDFKSKSANPEEKARQDAQADMAIDAWVLNQPPPQQVAGDSKGKIVLD